MFATPPKNDFDDEEDEEFKGIAETPGPHRARLKNLETQLSELVRDKHHLEKRYKSESKVKERELERCKAEGDGMREEVSFSN
jgi:hypothetical protein